MRMPSASFVQRSVILLSSSSAIFEYMEKMGHEVSPMLDPPCDGCDGGFCADGGMSGWVGWSSTTNVQENNEDRSRQEV